MWSSTISEGFPCHKFMTVCLFSEDTGPFPRAQSRTLCTTSDEFLRLWSAGVPPAVVAASRAATPGGRGRSRAVARSPTRGRRDADRSAAETAAVHMPERRRPAGWPAGVPRLRPGRAGESCIAHSAHPPRAARTPPGQPPRRRRSGFGCGSASLWSLWALW